MSKKLVLSLAMMGVLACFHSVFAQTGQQRIVQPIFINGQQAQGVMVVENGIVQVYACPSPQSYVTANQSESGWACFEQTTGMWLLHAQPPQQTTYAYQQPPVYVMAPTISTYSFDSYRYYPYGYYPNIVGPRFGVGFGFGYRSPIFVNRPNIRRPIIGRPFIGRPVGPFVQRPFGGFRQPRGAGRAVGRIGRR
jgi:hypothetical protein